MRLDDEAAQRPQGAGRADAPTGKRQFETPRGKPAAGGGALGDALLAAMRASKTGSK
jgi:hypothetical protein